MSESFPRYNLIQDAIEVAEIKAFFVDRASLPCVRVAFPGEADSEWHAIRLPDGMNPDGHYKEGDYIVRYEGECYEFLEAGFFNRHFKQV